MSARELMIARIYEIRDTFGNDVFDRNTVEVIPERITNPRTKRKWLAKMEERRNIYNIPWDGYENMSDEEIVTYFERIISRSYRQR